MNMETSVLIYSNDKYSDVWGPFFTLFFRYWACPYQVYLTTETEQCLLPEVKTINTDAPTWTERIKAAVEQIPTEYIIGMCEDFFFRRPVKQEVINACIMFMRYNKNIGCFNFEKEYDPECKLIPSQYPSFGRKPPGNHFQKSCQPTLWRKDYLLKLLDCEYDPWQWETIETEYPLDHYVWNGPHENIAFEYGYQEMKWFGIVKGKWFLPDVQPLFEHEGIQIDFTKRGAIQWQE